MPYDMLRHAASRWGSSQGENIATSAPVYLLETYPEARDTFTGSLFEISSDHDRPQPVRFIEQLASGAGRIDAAGIGPSGEQVVLIECKFDATLGDSQISGYFEELSRQGVLLFIVPRQRRTQTTLHAQEVLELTDDGFHENAPYLVAHVDGATVAITDWISVLDSLPPQAADPAYQGEVAGLRSYVDHMTGDDFVPIEAKELDGSIGRRWMQYAALFDEVIEKATAEGILSPEGPLAGSHGYSGRGLRIGPWVVWGGLWAGPWAETADTPLWLKINSDSEKPDYDTALRALQPLEVNGVSRWYGRRGDCIAPLHLKVAADRGEVVADLVEQLRELRDAILTATNTQQRSGNESDLLQRRRRSA